MDRKGVIHTLIKVIAFEMLEFIKEQESLFQGRWVPAVHIKDSLDLNFTAVPKENEQYGKKGWFFAIITRILEDQGLVEYMKDGDNKAFYRSK